jgi:hypothetical protein
MPTLLQLFYTGGQLLLSPVMVCGMHCAFAIKGLPAEVAANQIVEVLLSIFPSLVYPFVDKAWFYGFICILRSCYAEFVLFWATIYVSWCLLID